MASSAVPGLFFCFVATVLLVIVHVSAPTWSDVHYLRTSYGTFTLICQPTAAVLSGLALLFGLCGARYHSSGTVLMALCSSLAAIATLIALFPEILLFSIARDEFLKLRWSGQYGNTILITLVALVALLLAFCTAGCGILGSYRRQRQSPTRHGK